MKFLQMGLMIGMAAGLLGTGCGPMKDMSDMKAMTTEMKDATAKMKETTDATKNLVGASMLMGRAGAGKDLRDKAYAALIDPKQSATFKKKAVAAVSFLYSFEFQTYTGFAPDTVEMRETFYKPTIEELYWRTDNELNNLSAITHPNNRLSMAALGASLHRVNYLQKVAPVSVFDLIRSGTEAWIDYKNGKVPPSGFAPYQELVAKYISQTHALLNMRLEGLFMVALGSLSELSRSHFFSPRLELLLGLTPSVPETDTYRNNYFELKFDAEAMDHATTTLDLLERAGLPVSVNSKILNAARKLKLEDNRVGFLAVDSTQADLTFKKIHNVVSRVDRLKK